MIAAMNDTSVARTLAGFASGFRWSMAPQETRRVLQLSLLDYCAVALAGVDEPASRAVRAMLLAEGGIGEAGIIGGGQCPARAAALVNGTCAHALDYDDTHFAHIGHLAAVVFPAVLAVAEREGASGPACLEAALVGYELATHVGRWLGRGHYEAGFHQTATAGIFGAAVGAGRLLRLGEDALQHVLGLAATRAAGLKAQFGTMGKPYNAGMAASGAVEVALLVAGGFRANPHAVEAFGDTHAGEGNSEIFADLGKTYTVQEVSHKYHACCHGTHAALEALTQLRRGGLPIQELAAVDIRVHPRWLKVCNIASPTTGLEAKFSYRAVAAMQLMGRDTGALDSFAGDPSQDAGFRLLCDRINVAGDDRLSDSVAQVAVRLKTGQQLQASHDLKAPQTLQSREARLLAKAGTLVGTAQANRIWQVIQAFDCGGAVKRLSRLLREV